MICGSSILLVVLLVASSSFAEVITLPPDMRERLFANASSVKMFNSTKDIPAEVVDACARIAAGREFRLANPHEKFQVTDVTIEPNLPQRRLRWAARIPDYYLLHYEMGGRGHSYHVLLISYDEGRASANVTWSAVVDPPYDLLKDYNEFLQALKRGKLDDTRPYYH